MRSSSSATPGRYGKIVRPYRCGSSIPAGTVIVGRSGVPATGPLAEAVDGRPLLHRGRLGGGEGLGGTEVVYAGHLGDADLAPQCLRSRAPVERGELAKTPTPFEIRCQDVAWHVAIGA